MKVRVEICYEDAKKNRRELIELKGEPKGLRLMNQTERAVEKLMKKEGDDSWTRWSLVDIEE